jgi:hypothetical protein
MAATPRSTASTPRTMGTTPRSAAATPRTIGATPRSAAATPRSTTPQTIGSTPRSAAVTPPRVVAAAPQFMMPTPHVAMAPGSVAVVGGPLPVLHQSPGVQNMHFYPMFVGHQHPMNVAPSVAVQMQPVFHHQPMPMMTHMIRPLPTPIPLHSGHLQVNVGGPFPGPVMQMQPGPAWVLAARP